MTQDWERLGRRLGREHEKNRRAVGTRIGSATVMLWEQWTEVGRARVLLISLPQVSDAADSLARAVLGKDGVIRAARARTQRQVLYVLPIDEKDAPGETFQGTQFRPPWSIRWFDNRALAAGIGQQNGSEWVQTSATVAAILGRCTGRAARSAKG